MELTVFHERENITQTIQSAGKTVQDLLQQLNINCETVIVVRNNEVITESEVLQNNDKLMLLSVISGG